MRRAGSGLDRAGGSAGGADAAAAARGGSARGAEAAASPGDAGDADVATIRGARDLDTLLAADADAGGPLVVLLLRHCA